MGGSGNTVLGDVLSFLRTQYKPGPGQFLQIDPKILIDRMDLARLADHFRKVRATIREVVGAMPTHEALVGQIVGEPVRKS